MQMISQFPSTTISFDCLTLTEAEMAAIKNVITGIAVARTKEYKDKMTAQQCVMTPGHPQQMGANMESTNQTYITNLSCSFDLHLGTVTFREQSNEIVHVDK